MIYIGIDPGKSGAIAVINEDDSFIDAKPFNEQALISFISFYRDRKMFCVVEKVNAMPGQGVVSMFNFGQNYGFIQGVLKSYNVPYELVPPQKWKKEFSVTSDKNTSISVAKRLFHNVELRATSRCRKEHDGICEALLMAEYARRKYR